MLKNKCNNFSISNYLNFTIIKSTTTITALPKCYLEADSNGSIKYYHQPLSYIPFRVYSGSADSNTYWDSFGGIEMC